MEPIPGRRLWPRLILFFSVALSPGCEPEYDPAVDFSVNTPPPDRGVSSPSDAGLVAPGDAAAPVDEPQDAGPLHDDEEQHYEGVLMGGSMVVLSGRTVVAVDRDQDGIYIYDLVDLEAPTRFIQLRRFSRPTRVAAVGDRIFVSSWLSGEVSSLRVPPGGDQNVERVWQVAVCSQPRGLTSDSLGRVAVVCRDGRFLLLDQETGQIEQSRLVRDDLDQIIDDLMDVVAVPGGFLVSRLSTGDVHRVNNGSAGPPRRPVSISTDDEPSRTFDGRVAWRMIELGDGALLVHQFHQADSIDVRVRGAYGRGGAGCRTATPAVSALTRLGPEGHPLAESTILFDVALPIDAAFTPDGQRLAVVSAGQGHEAGGVVEYDAAILATTCASERVSRPSDYDEGAQVVAVSIDAVHGVIAQSIDPPGIFVNGHFVSPDRPYRRPGLGRTLFHRRADTDPASAIACATCHPGAGQDGHVWVIETDDGERLRRTPQLRGGIMETAPFHWDGEHRDLSSLMQQVFVGRMGGPQLDAIETAELERWLDRLPVDRMDPPAVDELDRFDLGKAVFGALGCTGCHSAPHYTSNVGYVLEPGGESIHAPPLLGLAFRAPYTSTGCAETLEARFDEACAPDPMHGVVRDQPAERQEALMFYLRHIEHDPSAARR